MESDKLEYVAFHRGGKSLTPQVESLELDRWEASGSPCDHDEVQNQLMARTSQKRVWDKKLKMLVLEKPARKTEYTFKRSRKRAEYPVMGTGGLVAEVFDKLTGVRLWTITGHLNEIEAEVRRLTGKNRDWVIVKMI